MQPDSPWNDPRTWTAIGSLIIGFIGFLFGVLSNSWSRRESRLDALTKILDPMFKCAQHIQKSKNARKDSMQLRTSFPNQETSAYASKKYSELLNEYAESIKKSGEEFKTAQAEIAARSFRFPEKIVQLLHKAFSSLSDLGCSVNDGDFNQYEIRKARFFDDFQQIQKIGRGWRLADPFEGFRKKRKKGIQQEVSHPSELTDESIRSLTRLVNKRAIDHAQNSVAIHPPRKLIENPAIIKSDKVIEELENSAFLVVFQDSETKLMNLYELLFFTFVIIMIKHQAEEANKVINKDYNGEIAITAEITILPSDLARPEMAKFLLDKIAFSPVACDEFTEEANQASI